MKNSKGQALVEFIIILPISLILLFCIIDFGRIISLKSELEGKTQDIVLFYENGKSIEEIDSIMNNKDIKVELVVNGSYDTLTISKKIKPITPGLSYIMDDAFNVKVSRVIRND